MAQKLTLDDGRELSFNVFGDPNGAPVMFSHGFSDSHVIRHPDDALTASFGIHWIAADQPGVGGSSPMKGRHMVDWGRDMEQLADHLGLATFCSAGHSGGGPHALSVAFHMPQRVTHVVLASPVAPFDDQGVTPMLVMKDLKDIVKIRRFPFLVRWALKSAARTVNKDIAAYVKTIGKELPNEAKTILRNPAQKSLFEENVRLAFLQKEEGVYEMTMALWGWGFQPRDVRQPVRIFYGDSDGIISQRMPQYLAGQLPSATTHLWSGANHYSFIDRDCWIDFINAAKASPAR